MWGTPTASCMSMRLYKFSSFLGRGGILRLGRNSRAPHPLYETLVMITIDFRRGLKVKQEIKCHRKYPKV